MERLWPAPSTYLAQVDEDIIILDLARDRYDGLMNAGAAVRLEASGSIRTADPAIARELCDAGIATSAEPARMEPRPEPPRRELSLDPQPPRGDIIRAAIVLSTATLRYRGRSLIQLVQDSPRLRPSPPLSHPQLQQLVGAVRVARPWIPFEGECLQRSFLLRSVLAAQGVATNWVFGVRTFPFAAHCWLQIGDMVVGDRLERVSRFVPIMRA